VRDTGIGIPDDQKEHVFDAFSQVENPLTQKHGGSGLGLSITSQLVTLMGGQIWLESQMGRGSAFEFTARFGVAERSDEAQTAADYHISGLSVIVVDDNEASRSMVDETLRSRGMRVTTVATGAQALEAVQQAHDSGEPFALAVIDSSLPDIVGFEVASAIREPVPLVGSILMMISGSSRRIEAERCRELGIGAYLVKPIKQQALLDSVRTAAVTTLFAEPPAPMQEVGIDAPVTRLNLLLAEDNAINRRLASRILEKRGHRVKVVGNGQEAIDAIASEPFDLVLMDVQMPVLDGLEATAAIRERERLRGGHIPIVAMTAHAMKGDREKCLEAGMDFYVSKPIQPRELIEVVESMTTPDDDGKMDGEGMADISVFDRTAALDRVEGDIDLLMELIELFFEQSPALMAEIHEHIAAGNALGVMSAAHSLKGSAGNLGASKAYDAANRLEQMARSGDLTGVDPLATELQHQILELTSALAVYRQEVLE
jgi:CheY-like chemotaxis protein